MKLVQAVIRTHQLPAVKEALYDRQISKITVSNILGSVQDTESDYDSEGEVSELKYRGAVRKVYVRQRTRVEVVVQDDFAEIAVDAISRAAHTGEYGDGIIFVYDVYDCVNIRTGERGPHAIG